MTIAGSPSFRRGCIAGCAGAWATAVIALSPAAGQVCPCPSILDLHAVVATADVIFIGRALSATADAAGATRNADGGWTAGDDFQTRLLFDVETTLKGSPARFVDVVTPIGPCSFRFTVGQTYLVSGKTRGQAVQTDSCSGNVAGTDAIGARAESIRAELEAVSPP